MTVLSSLPKIMPGARSPQIPEHVLTRVLDGEAVLLNIDTGIYFSLNRTGTQIWSLLQEGRTVEDVRREIHERFDAEPQVIDHDFDGLMDELVRRGLVSIES